MQPRECSALFEWEGLCRLTKKWQNISVTCAKKRFFERKGLSFLMEFTIMTT